MTTPATPLTASRPWLPAGSGKQHKALAPVAFRSQLEWLILEYEQLVVEHNRLVQENLILIERAPDAFRIEPPDPGASEPLKEASLLTVADVPPERLLKDEVLGSDVALERSVPTGRFNKPSLQVRVEPELPKGDDPPKGWSTSGGDHGTKNGKSQSIDTMEDQVVGSHSENKGVSVFPKWFDPGPALEDEDIAKGALEMGQAGKFDDTPRSDCGTLQPVGRTRLSWDACAFLCLLVELWMTPFGLVFLEDEAVPATLEWTSIGITLFFTVDIVLNFQTGFIQGDRTVMNRRAIARNYFAFWFWVDLVATVPFDLVLASVGGSVFSMARFGKASKALKTLRYLKMLRAARLLRTMRQATSVSRHFQILGPLRLLERPLQVLVFLVLFAHIHGCFWAALHPAWQRVSDVSVGMRRYFESFLWAYLAVTVGALGDPTRDSSPSIWLLEMIIASERLLLAVSGMFQVVFRALSYIENARTVQVKEDALEYLRRHKVSFRTQIQVLFSLTDTGLARKQQRYFDELRSNDLPLELRRSICEELWNGKLLSLGLIKHITTWHGDFLSELAQLAREEVLPSKTVIFNVGDAAIASYYVISGEVFLVKMLGQEKGSIPNFTKGMWVGENALVSSLLRRNATYVTQVITSLMVVRADGFHALISRLGLMRDFQTFCSQHLWKGLCGRCGQLGNHFSDSCPYSFPKGKEHRDVDQASHFSVNFEQHSLPNDSAQDEGTRDWEQQIELSHEPSYQSQPSPKSVATGHTSQSMDSSGNWIRRRSNSLGSDISNHMKALKDRWMDDSRGEGDLPHEKQQREKKHALGREVKQFLDENHISWLRPVLQDLDVKGLEDVAALDIDQIRVRVPHGYCLSQAQEESLNSTSIAEFRDRIASEAHKALFHAVSRLHHLIFLSHYKVEAGTEAALMRTELEHAIVEDPGSLGHNFDEPVFLDSENLNNLEDLQQRVRNTHNLVLLLTKEVLSRPWVLVEIVTARREDVRVRLVNVSKPGGAFVFPDDAFFARLRNGKFLDQDAIDVLNSCGISQDEIEESIRGIFKQIAVPYSPHKAASIRRAEIRSLLKQCRLKSES